MPIVIELLYLLSMVWIAMELEDGVYTPSIVFIEHILRLGYVIHYVHMMSCDLARGAKAIIQSDEGKNAISSLKPQMISSGFEGVSYGFIIDIIC